MRATPFHIRISVYLLLVYLFLNLRAGAQPVVSEDSLRYGLSHAQPDSAKIKWLQGLGLKLIYTKPDSSLLLYRQGLQIARKWNLTRMESVLLSYIGGLYSLNPELSDSAKIYLQQGSGLAIQNGFKEQEVVAYLFLSTAYMQYWNKPDSAIYFIKRARVLVDQFQVKDLWMYTNGTLHSIYLQSKKLDSLLVICLDGLQRAIRDKTGDKEEFYKTWLRYIFGNAAQTDTIAQLSGKALAWSHDQGNKKYECYILKLSANSYDNMGLYHQALQSFLGALRISTELNDKLEMASSLYFSGLIYYTLDQNKQALSYFLRARELQETIRDSTKMYTYEMIGNQYAKLKMRDSAIYFARLSYQEAFKYGEGHVEGGVLNDLGELYTELGEDSVAMVYFRQSLPDILANKNDYYYECEIYAGMAKLFARNGQPDSALFYARKALPISRQQYAYNYMYESGKLISDHFKNSGRMDSAFYYLQVAVEARDSLLSQDKAKAMQNIELGEQERAQQSREDNIRYKNRIRSYILLGGLLGLLIIAGILLKNNRQKQKTNRVLETTLSDLKSTQSQLIQSEKMASLGELTAGIAHEIQNPLNFVNNFSDVNTELIGELKAELATGNIQSANEIADNIIENEQKINHHGKRADAIVKGMLQHSRSSSGVKEPTEINALADEYLRLAYHGLRAKDKSFNATMRTDFDKSIGPVNIIPQDIGRVVLNLITNAFYAVNEKKKLHAGNYEPIVTVATRVLKPLPTGGGLGVEISVKDNGNGIPQKVLDKIFQPFFTTKPTGQGTGLGLSLSYDIVKAHGGEIKVETKENEGTEFVVQLPANSK